MRAAFHTLGCKTNAYETQAVIEQFENAGFQIGDFSEPCDVYVINTCAVTREAARKSRQMAGRCRRQNPDAVVVVTGCYAQEAGETIRNDALADLVVGNSDKSRILPLVTELLAKGTETEQTAAEGAVQIRDLSRCREYEDQTITGQGSHVRAYVKIQDGCDRFCSYCIIPFLRGRSRSRSIRDILAESEALAGNGYHEIVLTGIDISSFRDEAAGFGDPETALAELIAALDSIPGMERIRLGSLEAGIVSEKLLERLRNIRSFCPQFHLSLQSGSDTVLQRMNRHYSAEEYEQSVGLVRKYFPDAAITTDIIAGFPGETEAEFAETLHFVEKIAFSRIHAFPYSRREHTRADRMPDQLSKAVKEQRTRELIALGEQLKRQYEERLIGTPCRILAEEYIKTGSVQYLAGYTDTYVRILIPAGTKDPDHMPDASGPAGNASRINQFLCAVPKEYKDGVLYAEEL